MRTGPAPAAATTACANPAPRSARELASSTQSNHRFARRHHGGERRSFSRPRSADTRRSCPQYSASLARRACRRSWRPAWSMLRGRRHHPQFRRFLDERHQPARRCGPKTQGSRHARHGVPLCRLDYANLWGCRAFPLHPDARATPRSPGTLLKAPSRIWRSTAAGQVSRRAVSYRSYLGKQRADRFTDRDFVAFSPTKGSGARSPMHRIRARSPYRLGSSFDLHQPRTGNGGILCQTAEPLT
jgi:hypothetical protein